MEKANIKAVRGFQEVSKEFKKHPGKSAVIPRRKTNSSMAYDFTSLETVTIQPGEWHHFWTDIKAFMPGHNGLILNVRSSIGFKKHCRLINTAGWIDADYYNNEDNDGNIGICLHNFGKEPITIEEGERIAQGAFFTFHQTDDDWLYDKEVRKGGIGSTGEKDA